MAELNVLSAAPPDAYVAQFRDLFLGRMSFTERLKPSKLTDMRKSILWNETAVDNAAVAMQIAEGRGLYKDGVGVIVALSFDDAPEQAFPSGTCGVCWLPSTTTRFGLDLYAGLLKAYAKELGSRLEGHGPVQVSKR